MNLLQGCNKVFIQFFWRYKKKLKHGNYSWFTDKIDIQNRPGVFLCPVLKQGICVCGGCVPPFPPPPPPPPRRGRVLASKRQGCNCACFPIGPWGPPYLIGRSSTPPIPRSPPLLSRSYGWLWSRDRTECVRAGARSEDGGREHGRGFGAEWPRLGGRGHVLCHGEFAGDAAAPRGRPETAGHLGGLVHRVLRQLLSGKEKSKTKNTTQWNGELFHTQ